MKKFNVFSLMAVGLSLGFVACNNSGEGTGTADTTVNNTTTTTMSSGNYAARADSVKVNVTAGNYLNPSTGKAYTTLNVDQSTGALTDESGHSVRRYVDKRSWWVYDANSGDTVGSAEMQNGSLMYRGEKGDWQAYDKRWSDDTSMNSSNMNNTDNMSGNTNGSMTDTASMSGSGTSTNGTKVKVSDKGNKVKIKKTGN